MVYFADTQTASEKLMKINYPKEKQPKDMIAYRNINVI